MKKIIRILGLTVIAVAMFFSINEISSSNSDLNLAGLIAMNVAKVEDGRHVGCHYTGWYRNYCVHEASHTLVMNCVNMENATSCDW